MTDAGGAEPAWLGAIVAQSTEAIVAFDGDLVLVYANEAAHRLLRAAPGAVEGESVLRFLHDDDLARAAANIAAVDTGAAPRSGAMDLRLADGTRHLFEMTPMRVVVPGDAPDAGPGSVTVVVIRDAACRTRTGRS